MTDAFVSDLFDPAEWELAPGAEHYTDITAHVSRDGGVARIAFHRPEVRNAFRPHTVDELYRVLDHARMAPNVGVVLLTGAAYVDQPWTLPPPGPAAG